MKYIYMTLLQFPENEWEDHIVNILLSTTLLVCKTPSRTSSYWCTMGGDILQSYHLFPLVLPEFKKAIKTPSLWCFLLHDLLFSMKKNNWFSGHLMINNKQLIRQCYKSIIEPMTACLLHNTNTNITKLQK